jgi:phosphatidylinositol 4-kinase
MEKWGDALLGRTEEEDSSSPSWQSWWLNITAPNAPALGMDIDGGSRTNSSDFLSPQRKSGDDKTYKYSPLITAPRNFFQPFNDTISSAAKMLNPGNCGRVEAKGAGAGDSEEEEEDYGQWNLIPKGSKAKENLKLPYRYHAKSLTEESALKSAIIEMKDYSNSEAAFETSDPTMLEEGLNLCNEESTFQTSYPNSNAPNSNADLQSSISGRDEQEDPSAEKRPLVVFKEPWKAKEARLRKESPVGHLPGWKLVAVIVKSGDDLRQEQLAAQLIKQMQFILDSCGTKHWLQPYDIVAFSPDSGLIEAITDTVSLDALRRSTQTQNTKVSMLNFFESFFGPEDSKAFQRARDNFTVSLATYCIVCYILSLKDRHNGNLLLDNKGHIMHIDFGFILGKTPGGNIGFEKAPFKLTNDFIELMDGAHSAQFHKFRDVCVKTYMALRRHHRRIVLLLEMLARGNEHLPCFAGNPHRVIEDLRKRFRPELHDRAAMEFAHSLINASMDSWTTTCYDRYQKVAQGIF